MANIAQDVKLNSHAKFPANVCNSNQDTSDKQNWKWRPPPSWISI